MPPTFTVLSKESCPLPNWLGSSSRARFPQQGKARNYIDKEHIARIVEAYTAFEDVERFAHVADLEEMRANDFNLNISRYVDTTEPVEVMSVEDALAQLRDAERRRDEAVAKMDELLAELGYVR